MRYVLLVLALGCAHQKPTLIQRMTRLLDAFAEGVGKGPPVQRIEIVNARQFATCWIASVQATPDEPTYPSSSDDQDARVWAHRRDVAELRATVHDQGLVIQQMRECFEQITSVME